MTINPTTTIESPAYAVNAVANWLESAGPGDRAELRRAWDAPVPPLAFWQIWARFLRPVARSDGQIAAWARIVAGMATVPHRPGRGERLGRALAAAGVSEDRLLRLCRADTNTVGDEFRRILRILQNEGRPLDWAGDAGGLLLSEAGTDHGDRVRRHIARDYFFETFSGGAPVSAAATVDSPSPMSSPDQEATS